MTDLEESDFAKKFALEEYKAIQEKINHFRDNLTSLETFTIGGTVVAFGFLLKSCEIPTPAWFAFAIVVTAAGIRCGAYYIYVWFLRKYVREFEQHIIKTGGYKFVGVETFSESRFLRWLYVVVFVMWLILIGAAFFLAVAKYKGLVCA